jgi:hypothetical protein
MRPEDGPGPSAAQFELSARYGLSDTVDVGAKVYLIGGEIGMKWQPVRGRLDFAIAPALSYAAFNIDPGTSVNSLYLHLPLLFGWNVSDVVTIAFGPRLFFGKQFRTATPTRPEFLVVDGVLAGLFVAVPVRVMRTFWVAPEINAYASVGRGEFGSTTIYTGGVGFLFGGDERAAAAARDPDDDDSDVDDPDVDTTPDRRGRRTARRDGTARRRGADAPSPSSPTASSGASPPSVSPPGTTSPDTSVSSPGTTSPGTSAPGVPRVGGASEPASPPSGAPDRGIPPPPPGDTEGTPPRPRDANP